MKEFRCLSCGEVKYNKYYKKRKFCSNQCQQDYRWKNVTILLIESGQGADPKTLKKYLFEKRGRFCEECGTGEEYNGKPLVLQLDHKDGNSDNDHPDNLRLLCPNCHSQTETYGSKGQGNKFVKETRRNSYLRGYKNGDMGSERSW